MSWLKLDDAMLDHRKVRRAMRDGGLAAFGLHIAALLESSKYLTDGHIEDVSVDDLLDAGCVRGKARTTVVESLVRHGLWEPDAERGGYVIHDYLEHNPSRAQVEANRGVDRFRKELTRDHELIARIRARDGDNCRYCGVVVNWKDRKSAVGGTYDHVMPVSKGGGNDYANVVVACRGCNQRKGPRTPEEAGMNLAGSSRRPDVSSPNLAQESDSRPVPSRPVHYPPKPPQGGADKFVVIDGDDEEAA